MSATIFRFTEQAIEKLSGSDKRARYYDAQMPGLIIDVLPSNKKTFRVYKKLPGTQKPLSVTIGSFPSIAVEQARKQTRLRPSQLKPFLEVVNEMREEAIVHRQDFTATVCDFVEFMAFTGLRKTELLKLEWKNVLLDDSYSA